MKKILSMSVLSLSLLMIFASCSDSGLNNMSLISNFTNYKIYEYKYDESSSDYVFFIFDNNGKRLDAGYCQSHEPSIEKVDNNIIEYSLGFGTNAKEYKYYEINKGLVSQTYQNVYYRQNDTIAYIDYVNNSTYVCYKKVFETQDILKQKLDMGGITSTEYNISIDDNKLCVTHPKGKEYKEITEKFAL